MARLFVAVWPSASVIGHLAELPRREEPGVRWTTPEQWHVTLRFLGDTDPAAAEDALAGIHTGCAEASVGPRVGRLGRGVLMVPVAGLDALATSVRAATSHVGDPPDPRPFLGHLTLARLRNRGSCGLTGARVAASFAVTEVALVSSETHPDGARYTDLARFPLEAP